VPHILVNLDDALEILRADAFFERRTPVALQDGLDRRLIDAVDGAVDRHTPDDTGRAVDDADGERLSGQRVTREAFFGKLFVRVMLSQRLVQEFGHDYASFISELAS
jgi:hypothetical protein